MVLTTTNMGLFVGQGSDHIHDYFTAATNSVNQSLDKLDAHDHTNTKGIAIGRIVSGTTPPIVTGTGKLFGDITNKRIYISVSDAWKYATPIIGLITLWSGAIASIPSGWALCNGSNGTPDLRDRFVKGATSEGTIGQSGGVATQAFTHSHTLNLSVIAEASHTHTSGTSTAATSTHSHTVSLLSGYEGGEHIHYLSIDPPPTVYPTDGLSIYGFTVASADDTHRHTVSGTLSTAGGHSHTVTPQTINTVSHTHTITGSTSSGGVTPISMLPPYYALAYIMKV